MAVSGNFGFTSNVSDTRSIGAGGSINIGLSNFNANLSITDGTGAGQANKLIHQSRTLSGSSEDLDLSGVIADLLGTALTFTRIIGWAIVNSSLTNTLTIGAAGSNQWVGCLNAAGTITLRPSTAANPSFFACAAGDATAMAVTAGTGDILRIAGTAGQSYKIVLLGS